MKKKRLQRYMDDGSNNNHNSNNSHKNEICLLKSRLFYLNAVGSATVSHIIYYDFIKLAIFFVSCAALFVASLFLLLFFFSLAPSPQLNCRSCRSACKKPLKLFKLHTFIHKWIKCGYVRSDD